MIKSKQQVEMIIYENETLREFHDKCVETGINFYSDVIDEIANDLMWTQYNDVIKPLEIGDFAIISVKRPVEDLIKIIDETIEEYELEGYF